MSRSTIYVVFESRAGLFDAFIVDLWRRTGIADLARAVKATDAREHLRGALLAACRMLARDRDIYRVLYSMNALDPGSVGGAVEKMDKERRGGMEHLVNRLAEDGVLRDDVSKAEAVDLVWMLCSFDAFDLLHTDRGLSVEDVAALLHATIERTLCR